MRTAAREIFSQRQIKIPSRGSQSSQISSSRTNLRLDTTLCYETQHDIMKKKQGAISCLHTPIWGVEGATSNSVSKEMENSRLTESTACRVFNRIDDDLNTPDMNKTINFEDFLHASLTTDTAVTDMWDGIDFDFALPHPEASTMDHLSELVLHTEYAHTPIENAHITTEFVHTTTELTNTTAELTQTPTELSNTTTEHAYDTTEHVWAFETFEDSTVGLCLPAVEAEGARMDLPVTGEEAGTKDLLTWILEDAQIGDWSLPQEVSGTTQDFLIERLEEEEEGRQKEEKVKVEVLTEEEKYRRMREQNNRASQACRAKRKRKLVEEEEEVSRLEARNRELMDTLGRMEAQVAEMKQMVLEQVAVAGRQ